MKPFFENRNKLLRTECNALKREKHQSSPHSKMSDIVEEVLDEVAPKYANAMFPLSRQSILFYWTHKNPSKKKKHKKEAA